MSSNRKPGKGTRTVIVGAVIEPLTQDDFDNYMIVPAEVEDDRHDDNGISLLGIMEVPANDSAERLKALQDTVGGYIEAVYADTLNGEKMPFSLIAFVNEEGLINNLPFNLVASRLFGRPLFGPAVVFGQNPASDDTDEDDDNEPGIRSVSLGFLKMVTHACTGLLQTALETEVDRPIDRLNQQYLMQLLEIEGA